MDKRKVIGEEEIGKMVLPASSDVLGIAVRLLGFDRILVKCQDNRGDIFWWYRRSQAEWLRRKGYLTI